MNEDVVTGPQALVPSDRVQAEPLAHQLPMAQALPSNLGSDYVSLAAYWHILRKRWWTVVGATVVLATLVTIASFRERPIYKAVSRVQVEAETPLVQSLNDLYQKNDSDDELFLETQIQVVKSDVLAWKTIEELRLADDPAFAGPNRADHARRVDPVARKQDLISIFKGALSVELIPKTRMLLVGFENPDPRLAARVSSELVNNYIDYNFRQKYDATRQASGWMEQQLDELKAKVEASQQALVQYERQYSIVNTGEKQNVQEQMLSEVSRDLTTAQSDRIQKESLYNQVRANRSQMATLVHNDLLQKLEEKYADQKEQYVELLTQYGPTFPKVVRQQQQLNEIQAQITQEQNRVIERIRNDYNTAATRERLAAAAVSRQKDDLGRVNQLLVQHNILQREFEGNQQLYQNLMQRLKDATVSAGLRSTNLHLVDAALPPTAPVRPNKTLNVAIGTLAGMILGVMLAFGQEALDHSIRNVEEVENLVSCPALAVIPLRRHGVLAYGATKRSLPNRNAEVALAVSSDPTSVVAEAYRSLRTAILLCHGRSAPKTLLITSAQAGEGKTSTAVNLAQALAQRKGPVLLIDADLRKPSVAKLLNINGDKGLSSVISGKHRFQDAVQQYGAVPQLWVLAAGPKPANPADLVASEAMSELVRQCAARFAHIVIDSPPVLAVTDPAILSGLVDGVVLVVEGSRTARGALVRTHKVLTSSGAKILGVAVNKFDIRHQGYYAIDSYYYQSYKSQYGES